MVKKTILIIEDEKPLCDAIKMKLEDGGFNAICVSLAEEGLRILKEGKKIDIIWLDLRLPKMNGLDFLKTIKTDPELKDQKVIVVSVSAGFENKEKAKELGALDYIVKSEYPLNKIIERVVEQI